MNIYNNKREGNRFEDIVANVLCKKGYWVHRIQDKVNGQPFDIIAAKDGITMVIDCKDCKGKYFNLSRIEENQRNSMWLWNICGNGIGLFYIRFAESNITYIISSEDLFRLQDEGVKRIDEAKAKEMEIRMFHGINNKQ